MVLISSEISLFPKRNKNKNKAPFSEKKDLFDGNNKREHDLREGNLRRHGANFAAGSSEKEHHSAHASATKKKIGQAVKMKEG
jgi:hypothetical protein